jgi:hypothetical protein
MVSTFVNSFKFSFTQNANISIYFLNRIPLVGKKIPERLYRQTHSIVISKQKLPVIVTSPEALVKTGSFYFLLVLQ